MGETGPNNAITDVACIEVRATTLIDREEAYVIGQGRRYRPVDTAVLKRAAVLQGLLLNQTALL